MEKRLLSEICTVDINCDIGVISGKFKQNLSETILVIDSNNKLYGIITLGDFLRKARGKTAVELMNTNYTKLEQRSLGDDIEIKAKELLNKQTSIDLIPVVNNEKLLFVYTRNDFENPIKILNLKNNSEELKKFCLFTNIKSSAVIAENELLVFFGEILSKYISVKIFNGYDEFRSSKVSVDMIFVSHLTSSQESMKLESKGYFVLDFIWLFKFIIPIIEKISFLKKMVEQVFIFKIPSVYEIDNPSALELHFSKELPINLLDIAIRTGLSLTSDEHNDCVANLIQMRTNTIIRNSEVCWNDINTEHFNCINGRRITTDYIDNYKNKLFILGNSSCFGFGSNDSHTIPSFLQRIFNSTDKPYKVINCGVPSVLSLFNVIEEAMNGDKVLIIFGGYSHRLFSNFENSDEYPKLLVCFLKHLFDRPHEMGEVYLDKSHLNHIGNKKIAEEIFKILNNNPDIGIINFDDCKLPKRNEFDSLSEKGLGEFLSNIAKYKTESKNVGAIVMNCNPFTNGHKYLIKYAAKQVEKLYIFIVEEDKSYFEFKDRIALVKAETTSLSNVDILPSGKFMISTITFEEYFDKDALQNAIIKPAFDIEIFAKYISPTLNIKKRFAGEEPNCYVTNQYNNTMKEILPKYGIEFIEIPRKESSGKPISASTVRKMIKDKNLLGIKKIVPKSTLKLIKKKYLSKPTIE